jgi:hypothetical protein
MSKSEPHKETSMEAHGIQPSLDTPAPRRLSGRRAGRKLALVAVGSCLAVFGITGVAGAAVTTPDVSPIFCAAGVPCGGVSNNPPATSTEAAKKAAKEAEKAAKKAAKKATKQDKVNRHDLKQILGDSSLIDNGGHKWG